MSAFICIMDVMMKKILVVEDEKPILKLVQSILIRFGYDVAVAENAQEGIRSFNEEGYDLVITDMVMPGMNGDKVVKHIRNSNKCVTPIIGMSGTPKLFEGVGVDKVISKPFSIKALLDTVQCVFPSDCQSSG